MYASDVHLDRRYEHHKIVPFGPFGTRFCTFYSFFGLWVKNKENVCTVLYTTPIENMIIMSD